MTEDDELEHLRQENRALREALGCVAKKKLI
jgi:hypothetical protein